MRDLAVTSRRGFLQRTASALFLCALFGLLLITPGVSSEDGFAAGGNVPLYSDWHGVSLSEQPSELLLDDLLAEGVAEDSADLSVGSFSLHRPKSELFIKGLWGELYDIAAAAAVESDDVESYLQARARARVLQTTAPDFKTWLTNRGEGISDKLFLTSADYLTNFLSAQAKDGVQGMRFIRTIEWDYQTSLGDRRWQGGLSALGALRESNEDAIAWQLRGYAAEDSGTGANAGLIYRRLADPEGNSLWGLNVFLDYEKHGDYEEDFLRWSVGGEYRNIYLDIYLNRYFPISDAVLHDGNYIYTQGGQEAYLNVKTPDFGIGQVSGGLTYYLWEGEYGDADDKGLRYHIGFSPRRGNLNLELELDSPDGSDMDWGGRVSYRHIIGSADKGNGGGDSATPAFDARAHFFDAVRREYAQRIRESGAGARVAVATLLGDEDPNTTERAELTIFAAAAATDPATEVALTVAGETYTLSLSQTVGISVGAVPSTLSLVSDASNWTVAVYSGSEARLLESGSQMELNVGTLAFHRSGNGLNTLDVAGTTINLLGTRGEVGVNVPTATYDSFIHLMEGTIALTINSSTEISLDIVELQATAMVVDAIPVNGVVNSVTLMVGCATPQQRENHRRLRADFAGCVDDVRIGGLAEDTTVFLHAQGSDLTLAGVAGNGVALVEAGVTSTIVWGGDGYPFHPQEATLRVADNAVQLSHVEEVTESATLAATLTVATDSTVAFAYVNATQAAESAAAVSIYAAVLGGTVSNIDSSDGGAAAVGCSDNLAPSSENLVSVIAVCGELSFDDADNGMLELTGRVSVAQTQVVTLSGGGSGDDDASYVFALDGADSTLALLSPANTTAAMVTITGTEVILTLGASAEEFPDKSYILRATPQGALSLFAEAVVIEILLDNIKGIAVDDANEVVATVRTQLDANKAIHNITHSGALGVVSYAYVATPSTTPDPYSALRDNFMLNELVVTAPGGVAVTTNELRAAAVAIPPAEITANPTEFPLVVSVTDDDTAGLSGLRTTAEITFTVIVANPGDVKSTYALQNEGREDGDYKVFGRFGDADLATFTETGNTPLNYPAGSELSLSGLSNSGAYSYGFINAAGNAINIDGFVLVAADAPGESAALRLTTFGTPTPALPAAGGTYEMTVSIDDEHDESAAYTVEISISIVTPLSPPVGGVTEHNAGSKNVRGADEQVATISLANGYGTRSYQVVEVTPDTATGLFSAGPLPIDPSMGVITLKDDGGTHSTGDVVVVVEATDELDHSLRYTLRLGIVAPLVVNTGVQVPRQYVHTAHGGEVFYTPPDNLVTGGEGAHSYAIESVTSSDGLDTTHFGVNTADGALFLSAAGVAAAAAGNVAMVEVEVTDETTPDPQEVSYTVPVQIIDNAIAFDPAMEEWDINHDQTAATVTSFAATWSPAAPAADSDGITYKLAEVVSPAINPNPAVPGLEINANGELTLSSGAPDGEDSAVVMIEAAAAADNVSGVPPAVLQLDLDFHTQVAFASATPAEFSESTDNAADEVVHTFAATGGSGEYNFSIEGTPAANVVAIDKDSGVLSQTARQGSDLILDLTLKVTDKTPALGGSVTKEIQITWADIPAVNSDGLMYIMGGDNGSDLGDVWLSRDGNTWKEISSAAFSSRHSHAAAVLNGTIFVSGGMSGSTVLNDVWASADGGASWSRIATDMGGARAGHAMVNENGRLYLIGGIKAAEDARNSIRYSDDGVTWHSIFNAGLPGPYLNNVPRAPFDAAVVQHNGSVFIIGGAIRLEQGGTSTTNEVYAGNLTLATSDNITKSFGTLALVNSPPRLSRARAVSYNGRIYLIGGRIVVNDPVSGDDEAASNTEVWSSADGKDWRKEDFDPNNPSNIEGFGNLRDHVAYVKGISIFVAAGRTGDAAGDAVNDVWAYSAGGAWALTTADPAFGNRFAAAAVVHTPGVLVSGPVAKITKHKFPLQAGVDLFTITVATSFGEAFTSQITASFVGTAPAGVDAANYVAFDADNPSVVVLASAVGAAQALRVEVTITDDHDDTDVTFGPRNSASYTVTVEWTERDDYAPESADGAQIFVIGGGDFNDVWASSDQGINWSFLTDNAPPAIRVNGTPAAGNRGDLAAAVLGNTVYVSGGDAGGVLNDVWSSSNGVDWTLRSDYTDTAPEFAARHRHGMLALENTLYVFGGEDNSDRLNDVWYSNNEGVGWSIFVTNRYDPEPGEPQGKLKRFSPRRYFASFVHNGSLFVAGGDRGGNEVWASADGGDWELMHTFGFNRRDWRGVSYQGRAYLSGSSEVWSSVDGRTWVQETGTAAFGNLGLHGFVTHGNPAAKNKMFVIGGSASGKGQVWSSANGKAWAQVANTDATFPGPRRGSAAAVFVPIGLALVAPSEIAYRPGVFLTLSAVNNGSDTPAYQLTTSDPDVNSLISVNAANGEVTGDAGGATGLLEALMNATSGEISLVFRVDADTDTDTDTATVVLVNEFAVAEPSGVVESPAPHTADVTLFDFQTAGGTPPYIYTFIPSTDTNNPIDVDWFEANSETNKLILISVVGARSSGELKVKVTDADAGDVTIAINLILYPELVAATIPANRRKVIDDAGASAAGTALLTISSSGGKATGGYTYAFTPAAISAGIADYVSIDANGVLRRGSVVIEQELEITVLVGDGSAAGGALEVEVTVDWNFAPVAGAALAIGGEAAPDSLLNDVWGSANGDTWVPLTPAAEFAARRQHAVAVLEGTVYLTGGRGAAGVLDDIWSSTDGVVWTTVSLASGADRFEARSGHKMLAHKGSLYIIGGSGASGRLDDVWESANGTAWTRVSDTIIADDGDANTFDDDPRLGFSAFVHNGAMYFIGGGNGDLARDIWTSTDGGKTWDPKGEIAQDGQADARIDDSTGVSYKGRIYVIGGNLSDADRVWVSADDGATWEVTTAADLPFGARNGAAAWVQGDKLYGGGGSDPDFNNDVWSSEDGAEWTQSAQTAGAELDADNSNRFSPRRRYAAAVFEPALSLPAPEMFVLTGQHSLGSFILTLSAFGGTPAYNYSFVNLPAELAAVLELDTTTGSLKDRGEGLVEYLADDDDEKIAVDFRVTDGASPAVTKDAQVVITLANFFRLNGPEAPAIVNRGGAVDTLLFEVNAVGNTGEVSYAVGTAPGENIRVETGTRGPDPANADAGKVYIKATVSARTDVDVEIVATDAGAADSNNDTARITVRVVLLPANTNADPAMLIIGGRVADSLRGTASDSNAVWASKDGASWRILSPSAGKIFSARSDVAAAVLDDKVFVSGGIAAGTRFNDVWVSGDGGDWTQIASADTTNKRFPARARHEMFTHNGSLFVLGGIGSGAAALYDLWGSADGVEWSSISTIPSGTPNLRIARGFRQVFVHNATVIVSGDEVVTDFVFAEGGSGNIPVGGYRFQGNMWVTVGTVSGLANQDGPQAGVVFNPPADNPDRGDVLYYFTYGSDVRSSEDDGANWILAAENGRTFGEGEAVVHNGKIFVSGGENGGNWQNRIFSSTDGVTWPNNPQTIASNYYFFNHAMVGDFAPPFLPPLQVPPPLPDGETKAQSIAPHTAGQVLFTVAATAGTEKYAYSIGTVTPDTLEDHFSINRNNGEVSLAATVAEAAEAMVQVIITDGESTEMIEVAVSLSPVVDGIMVIGGRRDQKEEEGEGEVTAEGVPSNDVWFSTDGADWALLPKSSDPSTTLPERFEHSAIVVDGTMYVSGGSGYNDDESAIRKLSDVWASTDGIHWQERSSDDSGKRFTDRGRHRLFAQGDANTFFVVGGDAGENVWSSADQGRTWTLVPAPTDGGGLADCERSAAVAFAYNNTVALVGGRFGADDVEKRLVLFDGERCDGGGAVGTAPDVLTDAVVNAIKAVSYPPAGVVLNGNMYISADSHVFSSGDGRAWRQQTDAAEFAGGVTGLGGHAMLAYGEEMLIIGGQDDDARVGNVWSSVEDTDATPAKVLGKDWSAKTGSASLPALAGHAAVVLRLTSAAPALRDYRVIPDKAVIIGGENADGAALSDVWSSSMLGASWAELDDSTNLGARKDFAAVEAGGTIYVSGGQDADGKYLDDVWASTDGENWDERTKNLYGGDGFPARSHHGMVLVDDTMVIIGGKHGDAAAHSDIWTSTDYGITWTRATDEAPFGDLFSFALTRAAGFLYVIGGRQIDDGGNIAANNKVWVASETSGLKPFNWFGEDIGVVAIATDTASPPTPANYYGWTAVTDSADNIYLMGGVDDSDNYSDFVWRSAGANGGFSFGDGNPVWAILSGEDAFVSFGARAGHSAWVADDRIYIAGGENASGPLDTVWSSADGITWKQEAGAATDPAVPSFTARRGAAAVAIGAADIGQTLIPAPDAPAPPPPRMLVMGGLVQADAAPEGDYVRNDDVWFSTDGANWHTAADDTAVPDRSNYAVAVLSNTIYISGGANADGTTPTHSNEVWASADGEVWARQSSGQFPARYNHAMVARAGTLFIIGGHSGAAGAAALSDIWYSDNAGVNWSVLMDSPGTPAVCDARQGHSAVTHNGIVYILAGSSTDSAADVVAKVQVFDGSGSCADWNNNGAAVELPAALATAIGGLNQPAAAASFSPGSGEALLYIAGGSHVYSSQDGIAWTQRSAAAYGTDNGDENALAGHQLLTFNNRLFVLGGQENDDNDLRGGVNNVRSYTYKSGLVGGPDVNIELEEQPISGAGFRPRFAHGAAVLGEKPLRVLNVPLSSADNPIEAAYSGTDEVLFTLSTDGIGEGDAEYVLTGGEPSGLLTHFKANIATGEVTLVGGDEITEAVLVTVEFTVNDSEGTSRTDGTQNSQQVVVRLNPQPAARLFVIGGESGDTDATDGEGNLTDDRDGDGETDDFVTDNEVWASNDGASWSHINKDAAEDKKFPARRFHAVAVLSNTIYVSGGDDGRVRNRRNDVWASGDGVDWTQKSTGKIPQISRHAMIAHGGALFIIGATYTDGGGTQHKQIWYSANEGVAWTKASASTCVTGRENTLVVELDGRVIIFGGNDGEGGLTRVVHELSALDCSSLGNVSSGLGAVAGTANPRGALVSFKSSVYFMGANNVYSGDVTGNAWSDSLRTGDAGFGDDLGEYAAAAFNNKLFVLGGKAGFSEIRTDNVWSSVEDAAATPAKELGKDWTQEGGEGATGGAPTSTFRKRSGHAAVVASLPPPAEPPPPPEPARLLVIGGSSASDAVNNEVWESEDGEDWTQLTPTAGDKIFTARQGHAAVAHRGTVYVSGGTDLPPVGGFLLGAFSDVWASADGVDWTQKSTGQIPALASHHMLAHDGDLFILGGGDSGNSFNYHVWHSSDGGKTWATLAISNPLHSISSENDNLLVDVNVAALVHNGSLVVINGVRSGSGKVVALDLNVASPEWKELGSIPASDEDLSLPPLAALVFDNKMYLLSGAEIFSSADGKGEWTKESNTNARYRRTSDSANPIGGHAVVSISVSGSGVSRAVLTGGHYSNGGVNALRDNNGMVKPGVNSDVVWSSTDGTDWTELKNPPQFSARSRHAMVLIDPSDIDQTPPPPVVREERLFVIGGVSEDTDDRDGDSSVIDFVTDNEVWSSGNGANWTHINAAANTDKFPARSNHAVAVLSNTIYVSGGRGTGGRLDDVWSSADGVDWTLRTTHTGNTPEQIATDQRFPARSWHAMVAHDGTLFVIHGISAANRGLNDIWYSSGADVGENWAPLANAAACRVRDGALAVEHNGRIFIAAGSGGGFFTTGVDELRGTAAANLDCANLGNVPDELVAHHGGRRGGAIVSDNSLMYLIGGRSVYSAAGLPPDSEDWWIPKTTTAPFSLSDHAAAFFDSKLFILGGEDADDDEVNKVWSSTDDGATWTQEGGEGATGGAPTATFRKRYAHAAVMASVPATSPPPPPPPPVVNREERLFVIGGESDASGSFAPDDEVWSSGNGENWTHINIAAEAGKKFPARSWHSVAVLSNTIYVSGGFDGTNNLDDVWSSGNGVDWTLRTTHTGNAATDQRFPDRGLHAMVASGGTLFVIHGFSFTGFADLNDIWYSSGDDVGETWAPLANANTCLARQSVFAVEHNERVFIAAGFTGTPVFHARTDELRGTSPADLDCAGVGNTPGAFINALSSGTAGRGAIVSDNSLMYIIGGSHVYSAGLPLVNGTLSWSEKTIDGSNAHVDAPFGAQGNLRDHAAAFFDSKLFVLGGREGDTVVDKVWSSVEDAGATPATMLGRDWAQVTAGNTFRKRRYHAAVVASVPATSP